MTFIVVGVAVKRYWTFLSFHFLFIVSPVSHLILVLLFEWGLSTDGSGTGVLVPDVTLLRGGRMAAAGKGSGPSRLPKFPALPAHFGAAHSRHQ